MKAKKSAVKALCWVALAVAIVVPLGFVAASPLLAWRGPFYIAACFAGVIALCFLLLQPLFIGKMLPGLSMRLARRLHRMVGPLLVLSVLVHVGGLYIASPPDVIDALTFSSPTPFSNWGVIAMWGLFATATLALLRRRLRIRPHHWSIAHRMLAVVIVSCTVVHAILIEGTMETTSKIILSGLVVAASLAAVFGRRFWSDLRGRLMREN